MESVPTQDRRADFERLFGRMDSATQASIRAGLAGVDAALSELLGTARRIRPSSWRLVPTSIEAFPSGQTVISAYVEDGNAAEGITFWFELHAGNYHDIDPTAPKPPWHIETDVYVDGNEGRTECVHSNMREATDPARAVKALNEAVSDIQSQLVEKPPRASIWRASS